MKSILVALVLLACSQVARADGYNFYFDPGDVPVSFSIPTNFAPVSPFFSNGAVSLYSFGQVTSGPLVLQAMFEADFSNGQLVGTAISVPMTWTGPLPPPFDVMFDSEGEHQQFAASIFNLDASGNVISLNPGIYGFPFQNDGLQITLATPEPATLTLLLLAIMFSSGISRLSHKEHIHKGSASF